MSDEAHSQEELKIHAVRVSELASRDLNTAVVYLARTASQAIAVEWRVGIRAKFATLATLPRRCPIAPERFRLEVRRLLYRRTSGSAAHWIYFTIEGEGANSQDAPTVVIRHVRHAAAKPLSEPKSVRSKRRNNAADRGLTPLISHPRAGIFEAR
jgi:plasmid stabilization system protein ParE